MGDKSLKTMTVLYNKLNFKLRLVMAQLWMINFNSAPAGEPSALLVSFFFFFCHSRVDAESDVLVAKTANLGEPVAKICQRSN